MPFRDSCLTWMLRDVLISPGHTAVLACVSPANTCCDDSIDTLKFVSKMCAKDVRCATQVYREPASELTDSPEFTLTNHSSETDQIARNKQDEIGLCNVRHMQEDSSKEGYGAQSGANFSLGSRGSSDGDKQSSLITHILILQKISILELTSMSSPLQPRIPLASWQDTTML